MSEQVDTAVKLIKESERAAARAHKTIVARAEHLAKMTVADLRALAGVLGHKGMGKANKTTLVEKLNTTPTPPANGKANRAK